MRSIRSSGRLGFQRGALGFTLIEMLIAAAVIAILAAIAIPSYQEEVRRSRRAQAKADLVEYSQMAERFHTINNTYQGYALASTKTPREGSDTWYAITIEQAQSTFTITATPKGGQAKDYCGTLTINQASAKTPVESKASGCW
ncbi:MULTISPECIES: type IV pilin protein [Stenotrophomonas]|jgi:type IV pilus assembly protein PilE|uniref:type IV pilin protein n=1 Tax=Stenotrophomonas TaxID=40323 RepID=UPI0018D369A0|nr:type IV pilin protein [Stenotrophomonas sp.]MBH1508668.1 prepilin-type N-terminal cleavage/methylation domain-containing protein [Stenotrophomonas maltophilia]